MNSDSEPEQNNSGSERFTDFEKEIKRLVGAVAIDDDAEIDGTYMGEPLADEHWLKTTTVGERRRDNKMKCF